MWKHSQTNGAHSLTFDNINEGKNIHRHYISDIDDMSDYSTTTTPSSSVSSSTSYEHCLLSFFTENDTLTSRTNNDNKLTSIHPKNFLTQKQKCTNEKKSINNTVGTMMMFNNSNMKKRRVCINSSKSFSF